MFFQEFRVSWKKPKEGGYFREAEKIQSNNLDGKIGYCYLHIAIGNVALCWLTMLKQKVRLRFRKLQEDMVLDQVVYGGG